MSFWLDVGVPVVAEVLQLVEGQIIRIQDKRDGGGSQVYERGEGRDGTSRTTAMIPKREPLQPVLAIPFPAKFAPRINPMIPAGKYTITNRTVPIAFSISTPRRNCTNKLKRI